MLEEAQKEHNDVVDFLTDACKVLVTVQGPDGRPIQEQVLDTKKVSYKTQNIDSNYFGRNVLELEQLESCAEQSYFHMSKPRAEVISQQIKQWCKNYEYSYDAKNSETMKDPNNARQSLVGILSKNKAEHVYTLKEDGKRSLLDGLLGRQVEKDQDRD